MPFPSRWSLYGAFLMALMMLMDLKIAKGDVIFENKRTGGGDLTNLNYVINLLTLNLDLSIEPKPIDYKFGFVTVPLLATIGESGVCRDLLINEGGDIYVTGKFLEETVTLEGFDEPFQVYEIDILADIIQFECTIPLMVEVEGFFSFVNTIDGFGDLTFRSEAANLNQKILAYSTDFLNVPPIVAIPGACDADPDTLTYEGDSLGDVAGVDITDIIIEELEADPSYVFNDVKIELCKLGEELAAAISGILVSEVLTNTSSNLYVPNPFLPDDDNVTSALFLEEQLYETKPEAVEGLLDLTDSSNFFVDLIIAENNSEPAILNDVLTLLACDGECEADPLLLFIADFLDLELEEDGSILDVDLTQFFNRSLTFAFNTSVQEVLFFDMNLTVDSILLDYFAPQPEVEGEPAPSILQPFQAFSNHTALVEDLNFNDFQADAAIRLSMSLVNLGLEGNDFLQQPFELTFDEKFDFSFRWEGFLATFGVLFAFNVDYLKETELGPLLETFSDCLLALFPIAPAFSGLIIDHETIGLGLSDLNDAILVLVADIVEVAFPVYQSVLPRVIEKLVAELLVNKPLFNETQCGKADPGTDNLVSHPYDFSQGLFNSISEIATADTLNSLFENFEITDNGIYITGDKDGFEADEGIGFVVPIPAIDGWAQNISIYIQAFSLEGFIPPYFRDLQLFDVVETSEFAPQFLRSVLNVGIPGDGVALKFVLNVTAQDPFIDEENIDPADAAENPPEFFYRQDNILEVTFGVDNADILLDLYLKFTEYDVNSLQLQEFINLGCWGARLDYPGGISLFAVDVEGLNTTVKCEVCENEMVRQMANSFADESSYPEQLIFLDDFLNRFGFLLTNLFELDRFPQTKETSEMMCDALTYDLIGNLTEYEFHEYHGDFSALLPFMAFFMFAIMTPCMIARCLNHYGPKLKHVAKHHRNEAVNKELLKSARMGQDESLVEKAKNLELPMYKNPLISRRAKIMFPVILVLNFILFIIGDTGDAVRINIGGHFFLIPYEADNFRSLSVITSVIELFKSGGWLLGLLLLVLSILWPYVKLLIMGFCWVLPTTKLSVSRRGKIIEFLDFFGRFSFAEFHFLVFVLVVFQLSAGTPDNTFLPDVDFFTIKLEIEPLVSLFTFSLAVVLSIMVSNAMLVFQHNIEDETRIRDREAVLNTREDKEAKAILEMDEQKIKLTNWAFRVDEQDDHSKNHYHYHYNVTRTSIALLAGIVLTASACLLAASLTSSLRIEMYGFFAYLVKFAGDESAYELSVFDLLINAITLYSNNFIVYFVGMVFILTIAIIPVIQTVLLIVLLFKPVTLKGARQLTEAHHVMSVWCCIDVFVLAITLTVLELPTVAGGLTSSLDFCDDLGEVMLTFFEPMRYVTEEDVDAGCIAMKSYISQGAYVAVVSVFVLNIANFFVSRMFYSFIADREKVELRQVTHVQNDLSAIKSYHRTLQALGLIIIIQGSVDSYGTPMHRRELVGSHLMSSQANPMFESEEQKKSFFSTISEEGPKKGRRPTRPKSSLMAVRNSNPFFRENNEYEELVVKLNNFYDDVLDPKKKARSKAQAAKALKTSDGVDRLNVYLKGKYGRGLSGEVDF